MKKHEEAGLDPFSGVQDLRGTRPTDVVARPGDSLLLRWQGSKLAFKLDYMLVLPTTGPPSSAAASPSSVASGVPPVIVYFHGYGEVHWKGAPQVALGSNAAVVSIQCPKNAPIADTPEQPLQISFPLCEFKVHLNV